MRVCGRYIKVISFLYSVLVLSAPEMPRQSSLLSLVIRGEESPGSTGQGAR
jgi:hypothetical protein